MFIYVKDDKRLFNLDNGLVLSFSCGAIWMKHFNDETATIIKTEGSEEAFETIVQYMVLNNRCITI